MESWRGKGERKFQQAMLSPWQKGRRRETRKERGESNAREGIGSWASGDRRGDRTAEEGNSEEKRNGSWRVALPQRRKRLRVKAEE